MSRLSVFLLNEQNQITYTGAAWQLTPVDLALISPRKKSVSHMARLHTTCHGEK